MLAFTILRSLVIHRVVTLGSEIETQLLAIGRVLQVFAEVTHGPLRLGIDADQLNRARDRLVANLEVQHGRHDHRRRHRFNVIARNLADRFHVPVGVSETVHRSGFHDQVRQNPVDPVLHLRRESRHHTVDHDHRGHAERHADDRRQGNIAGAQITPGEEQLVHSSSFLRWFFNTPTEPDVECLGGILPPLLSLLAVVATPSIPPRPWACRTIRAAGEETESLRESSESSSAA